MEKFALEKTHAIEQRIGELLVAKGALSPARLEEALHLQERWGSRLGEILLAKGWVDSREFYQSLAVQLNKPFVELDKERADATLLDGEYLSDYAENLVMPWRESNGILTLAVADPGEKTWKFIEEHFDQNIDFVITSKFDIIDELQRIARNDLSDVALNRLFKRDPDHSARVVFTGSQLFFMHMAGTFFLLSLALWPIPTLLGLNILVSIFLLFNFGLKVVLAWVSGKAQNDLKVTDEEVRDLDERTLPVYTILVPLYKEPEVLSVITESLRAMDYPMSKLDVKLILEEDDEETFAAAKMLDLEPIFEIIQVPHSLPKTKPKACNYALNFARGDMVAIYDAEDKPEVDQLKKAVVAFSKAPENMAVFQARLNYFNANENWLTRMFTQEYSVWFDLYLPALETLKMPIPLGGTSNHFKAKILKEVKAWDPFNVTEDADFGIRMSQLGYRVGVFNSTTYEEANSRYGNWIRQRSRWLKGYMQTYLVHMRHPIKLYRSLGNTGFWGFQLFVGGTVFSVLVAPFLYAMYVYWLLTFTHTFDVLFPGIWLAISLFNLLFGNGFFIYLSMLGAFKRRYFGLIPYAIVSPFYWLMMSIASYKGLWQLFFKPFYWEKTQHGLTKYAPATQMIGEDQHEVDGIYKKPAAMTADEAKVA